MDINNLSPEQLRFLAEYEESKTKAVDNTNTAQLMYGSGGLWDLPGGESDVINNVMYTDSLRSMLPLFNSLNENPLYLSLTGIKSDDAGPPVADCAPSEAGFAEGCTLTAQFGRLQYDTKTIDTSKIHTFDNLGVTRNLQLLGQTVNPEQNQVPGTTVMEDRFNNVVTAEMGNVGSLFWTGSAAMLGHTRELWQGDPVNNTGGYKEFKGLDLLINTGHVDAITAIACPAMDSQVFDFTFQNVAETVVTSIARYMSHLLHEQDNIARKTGLGPVESVWVMTPDLWLELSAIWPIAYHTNRGADFFAASGFIGNVETLNTITATAMMRRNMTIDVEGRTMKVIADDGVAELDSVNINLNPGEFASSIYLVPLTVGTNRVPVTFMQYLDYAAAPDLSSMLPPNVQTFWTDNGIYSWAFDHLNWCFKLAAKTEQRVIFRTPQLAGRIDNVMYIPLQHLRDSDPTSAFYVAGGESSRGPLV